MESALAGWARQVTFLVLFVTVIEMLLPAGELRKYVKLVLGLVVLLALIDPLLRLAGAGSLAENLAGNLDEILSPPVLEAPIAPGTPVHHGIEMTRTLTEELAAESESMAGGR